MGETRAPWAEMVVVVVARRRRSERRDWSWMGDIVMGLVQAGEFDLGSGR